jgi:hypothetical protein
MTKHHTSTLFAPAWIGRAKFGLACLRKRVASQKDAESGTGVEDLYRSVWSHGGRVPLSWVRSTPEVPFSNLGDQLSATVIAAITRAPADHVHFNSRRSRLLGIGSIGHHQRAGVVHVWGSGFGAKLPNTAGKLEPFSGFPEITYKVHALRGPVSRSILTRIGVQSPRIFGDPAWFVSRILPHRPKPRHELGVVLHLAELAEPSPQAQPKKQILRYRGGAEDGVRLISTYHEPSWAGFQQKIQEILECKRIVSRSLHGMIIAEAFGIPCAFIANNSFDAHRIPVNADVTYLDARFADAYAGFGCDDILSYGMPRTSPTAWDKVIKALDELWKPISFDGSDLFDAFPLPKAVSFEDKDWSLPQNLIDALQW